MRREGTTSSQVKGVALFRDDDEARRRWVESGDAARAKRRLKYTTRERLLLHARAEVFERGFAFDEGPARAARGVGRDASGK